MFASTTTFVPGRSSTSWSCLSPATIVRVSAPRSTRSFRRSSAPSIPSASSIRPIRMSSSWKSSKLMRSSLGGFDVGHVGFVSGVVVRFVAAVVRLAVVAALLVRFVAVLRLSAARAPASR